MKRVRRLRAGEESALSPLRHILARVQGHVLAVRHLFQGGMPAIERLLIHVLVPNTKPERLLPHAAHHQP